MENDSSTRPIHKNHKWANFRVSPEEYAEFGQACDLLGRTKAQAFRQMLRATKAEARQYAAQLAQQVPPQFEMLTIEEARNFLKPYYHGKPPSAATLERRIADGTLIAVQDHNSRTTPLRVLKASLVQWMRRLGKELQDGMM